MMDSAFGQARNFQASVISGTYDQIPEVSR